ncbi:MAG: FmdB family zinc ribbon protein [Candidatus Limnocylindria bacterium]
MPTYDYQCRSCGTVTEVIHSMLEDGPSVCELCGGELRRVLFPTGIIFKGSGFYRTDSRATSTASGSGTDKDKSASPATDGASGTDGGAGTKKKASPGSTGSTPAPTSGET